MSLSTFLLNSTSSHLSLTVNALLGCKEKDEITHPPSPTPNFPSRPIFRLMDLPAIATRNVLRQIKMEHLIKAALVSTRFRENLRNCRLQLSFFKWMLVDQSRNMIRLRMNKNNECILIVQHCSDPSNEQLFPGTTSKASWTQQHNLIYVRVDSGRVYEAIMEITHFLMPLFVVKKSILKIWGPLDGNTNIHELSIWRYLKGFKNVSIKTHRLCGLTTPEWDFLKNNSNKVDSMELDVKLPKTNRHKFELTHRVMYLQNTEWLTLDKLLDMKCELVQIKCPLFPVEYLNKFIKSWMDGNVHKKFKCLAVCNRIRGYRMSEVIKEKDMHYYIPSWFSYYNPQLYFGRYNLLDSIQSCVHTQTVQRKRDGHVATISVSEEAIYFYVG